MTAEAADSPKPETPAAKTKAATYTVVARRYRPQAFDDVVGQQQVVRALTNAISQNRVAHAYLFTGARGVGKTSTARILAKCLNCERGTSPNPCNGCDTCRAISHGEDVDVLEIDGASNRGIDEMRELRQSAGVRPISSRYKIYIIDEVHMLTREAFNALLKTLEEPPEHVKFIFCTTEPEKIPITILSRCQRFDFGSIHTPAIVERLRQIAEREGYEVEEEALESLARRSGGSMRDSQSLLEQLLAFGGPKVTAAEVHHMLGTADDARVANLMEQLLAHNPAGVLQELDAAVTEGVDLGQFLDQILGYCRDLMVATVGGSSEQFLFSSSGQATMLGEAAGRLGLQTVLALMEILSEAKQRLRYSTQGRILTELALVRCCTLEELDELPRIAQAMSALGQAGLSVPTTGGPESSAGPRRTAASSEVKKKRREADDPANPTGVAVAQPAVEAVESAEPLPAESDPQQAEDPGQAADAEPTIQSAIELTDANVTQVWQRVQAELSETLHAYLSFAKNIAILAPNRLVLEFPAEYTFQRRACERSERVAELRQALGRVTGSEVQVEFRSAGVASARTINGGSPASSEPAPRPTAAPPAEASAGARTPAVANGHQPSADDVNARFAEAANNESDLDDAGTTAEPEPVADEPNRPRPVLVPMAEAEAEAASRPLLTRAAELFGARLVRFDRSAE